MTAATLRVVERVDDLCAALEPARVRGARIGFIPTMGALHEGHAELLRVARAECDVVVASCYVNPLQFGAGEDLDRYPRDRGADERVVAAAGVDVLWRPHTRDVYGDAGEHVEQLDVGPVGRVLEGASRPGHFDGVATVVARLLDAVRPDRIYLGEKDFQQLVVLRRLAGDRDAAVCVRAVPTVRDPDGLALSSRNAYLSQGERRRALAIPRALRAAARAAHAGEQDAEQVRATALAVLRAETGIDLDYLELVDASTLEPVGRLGDADAVLLVAARVGATRLIDNVRLGPAGSHTHAIAGGRPMTTPAQPSPDRPRLTPASLTAYVATGARLVMVTAYDHPSAQLAEAAGVDLVLVGDSAAMVVLGRESTNDVSMDEMVLFTRAASRATSRALVVGDLPFMSYQPSDELAITNAGRLVAEGGADMVKLEGGGRMVERVRAIDEAGIAVVAHLGLTPQSAAALGGFRAQARTAPEARRLLDDALALQAAGARALVLEAIPPEVASLVTERLAIPTIGIGAGAGTSGQVLVWHDLLGITERVPRFVRRFGDIRTPTVDALRAFAAEVRDGTFPDASHTYSMPGDELAELRRPTVSGGAPGAAVREA